MRNFAILAVLSGLLLLVACVEGSEVTAVPVDLSPTASSDLLPDMPGADEGVRARRRMDIDQLDASMRVVSGGIGWTELNNDGEEINLFEALAATLGVPDFVERTREDMTASVVFEKFLGDASRAVCSAMVGREMTSTTEHVLIVHSDLDQGWDDNPIGVEQNMRYLLLRFHGTNYAAGDPRLDPWLWLFRSSMHGGSEPGVAWHTVCVALYTHPDFYSY